MSGISEDVVLGIDLAGVTGSTGFAVLRGTERPHLADAGLLPATKTPLRSEEELVLLIDRVAPTRLVIDAPLTLPPCMACPDWCRGPGELCELEAARRMWADGSNPVIRRQCEVELKRLIPGAEPNPTMGLGIITARAVALVGKLESRPVAPMSVAGREILEIYPAASLRQMGWTNRPPKEDALEVRVQFYTEVVESLETEIDGLSDWPKCRENDDVFDALIAAYTGWLYPEGLVEPPSGFNLASGWIWFPKPAS
jgi:predicted nuclease with RNAse H fold